MDTRIKLILPLCILMILIFDFSNGYSRDKHARILVFAGAGMKEPLNEIGKSFTDKFRIAVDYDFEGSGRLGNKILAGQMPDLLISGGERWAKLLKAKGLIKNYRQVACHIPVIIANNNTTKINCLNDLAKQDIRLIIGDERACAIGKATGIIFKKAGLDKSKLNIIAMGVTVKQLVYWIEQNNADASIVWRADAANSGKVKIIDIPESINYIDIIPVCTMSRPEHPKIASKYIKFILSEGKTVFEKCGFITTY